MTYALDTNTVSLLIKSEHTVVKNFREKIIAKENNYTIPYIVFYEVMRQSGQLIGDADILVAAYCIVNGLHSLQTIQRTFAA